MKKCLHVIASAAAAMSAFASVALADDAATTTSATAAATSTTNATKSSADFKDLANADAGLKAKIDVLLKAGVFEGVSADSFGIDQSMTRAQFAKVLDLIYGVKVDTSVTNSNFADVKSDDPANGWAIPYVEAAKKAGLIDGKSDTTFDPGAYVTMGVFATALVKGVGVKPDVTGTPWYADAVMQAIAKNILPAGTDGSKTATRADLVVGAYGGQQAYASLNQPAQVSVTAVKATGVQTVVVNFDRDVDTSKATLSINKGTIAVNTTTKFSDDKKSATLTLTDTKLSAGDYTVSLGGLDASAIKTATGTFTAQDETVQKLEFVSSSDTVAYTKQASVIVKATNQYGENASFSAGSYSVILGNGSASTITKLADGTLRIKFDSTQNTTSGVTMIPVYIYSNDTHVTASKNFTVGVAPFVTKMDMAPAVYSNGTGISKQGDIATYNITLYDQYGDVIGYDDTADYDNNKYTAIINPYESDLSAQFGNFNNDGVTPQLRVSLNDNLDKASDYTIQVFYLGASATAKLSTNAGAVATKVQIGDVSNVIASYDTDIYIPVIAYDANGNQLSTSDLTSSQNVNRIKISDSTGTADATITTTGQKQGYIHIARIALAPKSVISITAYIAEPNANSTSTKTFVVGNMRVPDHLKVSTEPATKLVAGAKTSFTVQTIDQYGGVLDKAYVVGANGNLVTSTDSTQDQSSVAGNVYYYVNLAPTANAFIYKDSDASKTAISGDFKNANPAVSVGNGVYATQMAGVGTLDTTIDIANPSAVGTAGFRATLYKQVVPAGGTAAIAPIPISQVSRNVDIVTSTNDLIYTVNKVSALPNTLDSGIVPAGGFSYTNVTGTYLFDLTSAANIEDGHLTKEVTVSVKDAAGNSVALPQSHNIVAVTSSNSTVARVVYTNDNRAWVLGNKAGTATIGLSYRAADGTIKAASTTVTIKSDPISVDHLTAGNTGVQALGSTSNAWDLMDLQVYDNYGIEYEKQAALKFNYMLGVSFSITNIRGGGTVTVDQNGLFGINGTVTSFDLTAVSANGKSATTPISVALAGAPAGLTYAQGTVSGQTVIENTTTAMEYSADGGTTWTTASASNTVVSGVAVNIGVLVRTAANGSVPASLATLHVLQTSEVK